MAVSPALAPRRWALGAAGIVFALGFGALALASALGLGNQSLPGLYTFRSATIGDGFLLPLLAYALVRSAGLARDWSRNDRRAITAAVVIGVLAGSALQARWLTDPDPRVNWTLPAEGTFNLVGWHHAMFLVMACGFFAGAATAAVARLRREARSDTGKSGPTAAAVVRARSPGILGVLFPALAFVALLAEDNSVGGSALVDVVVRLVPLTVLATGVLTWAVGPATLRWCGLACVAVTLPAMSVPLLFLPDRIISVTTVLPVVCAALVGAFGASALWLRPGGGRIVVPMLSAVCAAGPVHAFSSLSTVTIPMLAVGCAVSAAALVAELLVVRSLFGHTVARLGLVVLTPLAAVPIVAFSLAGRYFAQEQHLISSYANIVGVVAAALLLGVSAYAIRVPFDEVIRAEEANARLEELAGLKWTVYPGIFAIYAALVLAFLAFLAGTTHSGKWIAGAIGGFGLLAVLALILVAVALVMGSLSGPAARLVTPLACLAWATVMGFQLASGYGDWKQALLSILIAVVVGLFVLEGVVSNAGYLHHVPVDRQVLGTGASCALAASSTSAWLTGPALWSASAVTSVPLALTSLAIGATACVLLPWLAARTLPGARPPRTYTPGTPVGGVLQDCFLMTLLGTSVAWAPNLFMAHLDDVAARWSAVIPFLTVLSMAYLYALKNNIGHVHRERRRKTDLAEEADTPLPPDEERALVALAKHVQRQNQLAIFALFPLGFLVLFTQITGFDREGLRQITTV